MGANVDWVGLQLIDSIGQPDPKSMLELVERTLQ